MAESKKDVWVDMMFSASLIGKESSQILSEKIKALAKEIEEIVPGGRLSVAVSGEKEKFHQNEKMISNIIKSRSIYNERGFMKDPSLAIEFSEISGHIRSINNIIDKRKKRGKNERYSAKK